MSDLRREYSIGPAELDDPDLLRSGFLVAYLTGLTPDSRLVQALAAEQRSDSATDPAAVIGVSDAGRPIVARGAGPRTVEPDAGALHRGATAGLFEVID